MVFSDNKGEGYATLAGTVRLQNDTVRKKSLWKFNYEAFFPGGLEGNGFILTLFTPHRIEIMHFT